MLWMRRANNKTYTLKSKNFPGVGWFKVPKRLEKDIVDRSYPWWDGGFKRCAP